MLEKGIAVTTVATLVNSADNKTDNYNISTCVETRIDLTKRALIFGLLVTCTSLCIPAYERIFACHRVCSIVNKPRFMTDAKRIAKQRDNVSLASNVCSVTCMRTLSYVHRLLFTPFVFLFLLSKDKRLTFISGRSRNH